MSKIKDGLYGFIVGDAMGVPTEFCIREKLFNNPVTEMIGYGSHPVPAGSFSDDTSMTLALIDSIINNKCIDYEDVMNNFVDWVNFGKYTPEDKVFDIGKTCLKAISNYRRGTSALKCGLVGVNYNGNGSLMRILPLVYYIFYNNIKSDDEILELVNNISSLTHGHNISKMGCYIYVRYALYLLDGFDKFDVYGKIKELDYSMYGEEAISVYNRIIKDDISKYNINDISSSGYVVDTLESVIWILLNTYNYKQAIIGSINLGNDTDTIAAICGSLAGIIYGYNDIPKKWINGLIKLDYLKDIINKFEEVLYGSKKNAVIGAIIGDIVGSRFEKNNCRNIKFNLFDKTCKITDDSIMTLAVAKTCVDNNFDNDHIIKNMVELGRKYNDCGFGRKFYSWIMSDVHEPYYSYGNGAAMRISPIGVVSKSEKEVKELSKIITEVSHNHPDGIKGAEAVSMMIYLIRIGKSKEELKKYFINNYYELNFTYEDLLNNYRFTTKCYETVPQSFLCFLESCDFEDAIRRAISIGGDSDTIAVICGSMAAEYYGIPKFIYDRVFDYLDETQLNILMKFNENYCL